MGTLTQRFFASLSSSYLIQGLTSGVNFLLKLGLAWLIAPEDFGLYAVALFILTVVNGLRDFGLETQTVRDAEPDYGSIFWFHLGSGLLCAPLLWFGAPLFAGFHPLLPSLLRVFSPIVIFSAMSTVPLLFLNRTLQLKRTLIPRLVQLAVYAGLAVLLARLWHATPGGGALALIYAKLISEAALVAALWFGFKLPGGWRFRWSALKPMLWRARFLYLLGLVELLAIDIDKAILSRNCSETVVGYYFMAWSLVFFFTKAIEPAFIRVLFPAFARLQADPTRAGRLYTWSTLAIIALEVPCYFTLAAFAGDLVGILFPGAWAGMIPIVAALAFLPIIDPFSMLGVEVLRSRHRDLSLFLPATACLATLLLAGNFLTRRYGALGMVLTNYGAHLFSLAVILQVRRLIYPGYFHLLRRLPAVYGISLLAVTLSRSAARATPLINLGWAAAGIGLAWGLLALLFFRERGVILRLERD